MSKKNKKKSKKILVLGLDNSGKTSIVLTFIGNSNLSNFTNLDTTISPKMIKFEKYDLDFYIWDFGGKEEYRIDFLKNFSKYINETEEIFYVINVQDLERYDLSLNYLKEIIERTKLLNIIPEITIFLHKYDQNLFEINRNITETTINSLIVKVKEIIPSQYFHEIYKSTVYTVLDKLHVY